MSTFQALPLHIAEAIAHYCTDTYRLYHADIHHEKHRRQIRRVLYDVSNIWRVLALRCFCEKLQVTFSAWPYTEVSFKYLPPSIEVQKHFYNYVKELTLSIEDVSGELYSVIVERYNEDWPNGITLNSASSLIICISCAPYNLADDYNHVATKDLFNCLQRIRLSMPKLREVEIDGVLKYSYRPDDLENTAEPKLDSLFVDIFKRTSKLGGRTCPALLDGRDALLLDGSLITSLCYTVRDDMEYFSIVLQRLGPTLESLEINDFPLVSIEALVVNSDGDPIIYSQLKKLNFHAYPIIRHAEIPLLGSAATPFPNLCFLAWQSYYSFKDDVLFRGSHSTLEVLYIKLDRTVLDVLEGYDIAIKGRYARLRHVGVMKVADYMYPNDYSDRLLTFGANLITPETQTFETDGNCSWQQVFDTFSTCPHAENIRILTLDGTQLRLLQMLTLIKLLPNMTGFACRFNGLAQDTHKKKNRTAVARLYTEYYPLSYRLKCWEVIGKSLRVTQLVTAAITLAVLCPSFTFVVVPPDEADEYQAKLKKAIDSREYRDHRHKIERLISK